MLPYPTNISRLDSCTNESFCGNEKIDIRDNSESNLEIKHHEKQVEVEYFNETTEVKN